MSQSINSRERNQNMTSSFSFDDNNSMMIPNHQMKKLREEYAKAKGRASYFEPTFDAPVPLDKRVHNEQAIRVYSALSSLLYASIGASKVDELERFIMKRASALPKQMFDLVEWSEALELAREVRQSAYGNIRPLSPRKQSYFISRAEIPGLNATGMNANSSQEDTNTIGSGVIPGSYLELNDVLPKSYTSSAPIQQTNNNLSQQQQYFARVNNNTSELEYHRNNYTQLIKADLKSIRSSVSTQLSMFEGELSQLGAALYKALGSIRKREINLHDQIKELTHSLVEEKRTSNQLKEELNKISISSDNYINNNINNNGEEGKNKDNNDDVEALETLESLEQLKLEYERKLKELQSEVDVNKIEQKALQDKLEVSETENENNKSKIEKFSQLLREERDAAGGLRQQLELIRVDNDRKDTEIARAKAQVTTATANSGRSSLTNISDDDAIKWDVDVVKTDKEKETEALEVEKASLMNTIEQGSLSIKQLNEQLYHATTQLEEVRNDNSRLVTERDQARSQVLQLKVQLQNEVKPQVASLQPENKLLHSNIMGGVIMPDTDNNKQIIDSSSENGTDALNDKGSSISSSSSNKGGVSKAPLTREAAISILQSHIRNYLKAKSIAIYAASLTSGVLQSCPGTIQGETGWYEYGDYTCLFASTPNTGGYKLLCGPIDNHFLEDTAHNVYSTLKSSGFNFGTRKYDKYMRLPKEVKLDLISIEVIHRMNGSMKAEINNMRDQITKLEEDVKHHKSIASSENASSSGMNPNKLNISASTGASDLSTTQLIQLTPRRERKLVKLQSISRSFVARNQVSRFKQQLLARVNGRLVAMNNTIQGESGWYTHNDNIYYFVTTNGSIVGSGNSSSSSSNGQKEWIKVLGPISLKHFQSLEQQCLERSPSEIPSRSFLKYSNSISDQSPSPVHIQAKLPNQGELLINKRNKRLYVSLPIENYAI